MKPAHLANALFVLALVFLVFSGGIAVSLFKVWPYPIFANAYQAAQSELAQSRTAASPLKTDLWRSARFSARGTTVADTAKMQPGYTLYTSGDASVARLIDAQGHVLHKWQRPFSQIWDDSAAVKNPQADDFIYMRRARLLPNGHLLAVYISANDTPWGYGLVELDADSNVVWKYLSQVHHDLDLTNDGRIVTLTHAFNDKPLAGFDFVPTPYLEDFLVTLSPDGKELSKVSITKMLAQSPYATVLRRAMPWFANFDALHVNTVDWLSAADAKALGFGKAGDVLLMLRNINLLILVDPDTKRIVWGTRGDWLDPHDPQVLANGHILIFDNLGEMAPNNPSRVYEFDPKDDRITWSYTGPAKAPLASPIRSTAERLANGNTLITESDGGRLLEVTPDKALVWEYINPIRAGKNDHMIPVVSGARRIDPATLDPAFRATLSAAEDKARQSKAPQ
ncbi:arylsulfotransferase family protein [Salinisphaera sp. Q1T1-3]|uniref:arylsulfotransferase family protein n=1 Tax=Salinisphaera sp. Q1T1-3 TaxID=2321229 RepID=UPI000E738C6A|nr:arylsulfotransferase family protein [Salinisphaera sp. Q1T1-3]RJS91623.1 hypothetical protein D3260_15060 [Salinisphaera sp. Q1T1-3]